MSWKVSIPTAIVTAAVIVAGPIQYERNAALSDKPSIRLRVWTGDLPSSDLQRVLEDTETQRQQEAARADAMQKAERLQRVMAPVIEEEMKKLQDRIETKRIEWGR